MSHTFVGTNYETDRQTDEDKQQQQQHHNPTTATTTTTAAQQFAWSNVRLWKWVAEYMSSDYHIITMCT